MMRGVTIAGGGLAGLALGIGLRRRGVPVRLIEAASYPRHRVCGEFISGIAEAEIAELGLSGAFESAHVHRSTLWADAKRELLRHELPAVAYGLSRFALDAAMVDCFKELDGELRTSERCDSTGEGIVWATGRIRRPSPWIGLKAHFEDLPLTADLEVHLGDTGYVGLAKVERGRVNVCGLFQRSDGLGGDDAIVRAILGCGLPALAERLRGGSLIRESLKGVTNFDLGWQAAPAGRLCVGDAAAMIPPFTGNGMSMALQGGLGAAEWVERWSKGEATWEETTRAIQRMHRRKFGSRLRWARWMHVLVLHRAGRRLALALFASGLVRFETLYAKVR